MLRPSLLPTRCRPPCTACSLSPTAQPLFSTPSPPTHTQINADKWSTVEALRACIGSQQEDSDHPIMEAQLAAQRGNSTSGQGEVRPRRAGRGRGEPSMWRRRPPTVRACRRLQLSFCPPSSPPSTHSQVFILPTIRINGVQYRGKMATAEVLRALCAGFSAGNMPQV